MSRDNSQPFQRGTTFYGPDATINLSDLAGSAFLGHEYFFDDVNYASTENTKPVRSGLPVTVRAVRNSSGLTLYGKDLALLNAAGTDIVGRTTLSDDHGYPIDEFLPSTGVRNGDICYVVVSGYATMKTPMTGALFQGSDIAVGARLYSVTSSAGSTAAGTTGVPGRVAPTFIGAAATTNTPLVTIAHGAAWVAVALTARTTGETNADVLVNVRKRQ